MVIFIFFGGGLFFLITFKNDGMYGQKIIVNCKNSGSHSNSLLGMCYECCFTKWSGISTLCFVRCTYSLFPVLFMFIINYHYTQLRNMYHSVS